MEESTTNEERGTRNKRKSNRVGGSAARYSHLRVEGSYKRKKVWGQTREWAINVGRNDC